MVRLPAFLLLLSAAAALPAWAQIQPRSLQTIDDPKGEFSLSLRMNSNVDVTFRDVGTLGNRQEIGDQWSEMNRFYDDGSVAMDQRRASDGTDFPDDGRTNTWRMGYVSQVVDEDGDGLGDGIAFHRYSTESRGTSVDMESSEIPGIDLDYSYAFGSFGGRLRNQSPRFTWGGQAGMGLSSINAKTNAIINTTLIMDEDRYSLDGARAPTEAYTAPSSQTTTVTDPNGNDVSNTIDTTILLANRPYYRSLGQETVGGAPVNGFWQVRGGAVTARGGVWLRYRPFERLALRAGLGLTASYVGLTMRYDERLNFEKQLTPLRHRSETSPDKTTYFGGYGTLDAELWLSPTTGIFIGASYEKVNEDIDIPLDGRTAEVRLGSGTGFRLGFTKLF